MLLVLGGAGGDPPCNLPWSSVMASSETSQIQSPRTGFQCLSWGGYTVQPQQVASTSLVVSIQAMGRIFVGLCQVGAWGCFDEFNRLEERMLSAVSQQVQCIQEALREHSNPNYDKSKTSCQLFPQCERNSKL